MLFNILLEHLLITFFFMIAVYSDWFYSQFYIKGEDSQLEMSSMYYNI